MELTPSWMPKRQEACAWREIDSETLVAQGATGTVSLLNTVGGKIWEMCDGKTPLELIIETLEHEYDADTVEITKQVSAFFEEMIEKKLIHSPMKGKGG
jgi:hypothetical protein